MDPYNVTLYPPTKSDLETGIFTSNLARKKFIAGTKSYATYWTGTPTSAQYTYCVTSAGVLTSLVVDDYYGRDNVVICFDL